ncbi:unnamed protein product, partial [Didymodactylos carnosus]
VDLRRFKRDILTLNRHPTVRKQNYREIEIFVLADDYDLNSSYYPVITFDDEYYKENYFNTQIDSYEYIEYTSEQDKRQQEKTEKEINEYNEKLNQLKFRYENFNE